MIGPTTINYGQPRPCMMNALGNAKGMSSDAKKLAVELLEKINFYYPRAHNARILIIGGMEHTGFFDEIFNERNVRISEAYTKAGSAVQNLSDNIITPKSTPHAIIWVDSSTNSSNCEKRETPLGQSLYMALVRIKQLNIPVIPLRVGEFSGSLLSCAPSVFVTNQQQDKNPNLVSVIRKIVEIVGEYHDTSHLVELEQRADLLEEQAAKGDVAPPSPLQQALPPPPIAPKNDLDKKVLAKPSMVDAIRQEMQAIEAVDRSRYLQTKEILLELFKEGLHNRYATMVFDVRSLPDKAIEEFIESLIQSGCAAKRTPEASRLINDRGVHVRQDNVTVYNSRGEKGRSHDFLNIYKKLEKGMF